MKFALLLLLVAGVAKAALPTPAETKDAINQRSPIGPQFQLGDQLVDKKVHVLRARWDFAAAGGAVGSINLKDVADNKVAQLPPGALIQDCAIHVVTPVTSGGSATLAIGSGWMGNDLKNVTAKTAFANSDGFVACNPAGTVATSIKLPPYTKGYTKAYTPSLTIGTAALTAGKLDVLIKYILTE
jgi:hypothetical protein